MSWFYQNAVRPLLFSGDSEEIHRVTLAGLGSVSRVPLLCDAVQTFCGSEELPVDVFGMRFPNPVGLAAGMDKYAEAVPVWRSLGFGFSELGGVTSHEQTGNPVPRLFRGVEDGALVNRMGFNNPGAQRMAEILGSWKGCGRWPEHPVGVNLGKSKVTPLEDAARDYADSFRLLKPFADFFVVNVSSPNTPNLRQLQDKAALDSILAAIQKENRPSASGGFAKPLLVKVAPDLSWEALDDIVDLVLARKVSGIVATNTTVSRPESVSLSLKQTYAEAGGLSGRPLRARSTDIVQHLWKQTKGKVPIIGVGGIFNAADAWEKIVAGATLVEAYTGLVYEGPTLARQIVEGLRKRLEECGFESIQDAVGSANK